MPTKAEKGLNFLSIHPNGRSTTTADFDDDNSKTEQYQKGDKLIEFLRNDEELIALRKKWSEKKKSAFPPYNYDEYAGISGYKNTIKEMLEDYNIE